MTQKKWGWEHLPGAVCAGEEDRGVPEGGQGRQFRDRLGPSFRRLCPERMLLLEAQG